MNGTSYEIDSGRRVEQQHRLSGRQQGSSSRHQGRLLPVPPVDAFQDIRSAMCDALEEMGMKVEVHHHEVATGGQCEIGVWRGGLVRKADEVQILKYAIHNVAHSYGKTRHVHAEAAGRRQRLGHARAPVAAEGGHGAVRG
jgi:glutamine synthetase